MWREPQFLFISAGVFFGGGIVNLLTFGVKGGIWLCVGFCSLAAVFLLAGLGLTYRRRKLAKKRESELGVKLTKTEDYIDNGNTL